VLFFCQVEVSVSGW